MIKIFTKLKRQIGRLLKLRLFSYCSRAKVSISKVFTFLMKNFQVELKPKVKHEVHSDRCAVYHPPLH